MCATLPTIPRDASRSRWSRANGATPKCKSAGGMILRWRDVALGQDVPGGGHLSASADLGFVLPSYPRFQSISQPIPIRSACGPRLKEPIPRPDSLVLAAQLPGSSKTTVGLARQWEHVGSPAPTGSPELASCTLLLPWPRSSGPEVGCQMPDEPT